MQILEGCSEVGFGPVRNGIGTVYKKKNYKQSHVLLKAHYPMEELGPDAI